MGTYLRTLTSYKDSSQNHQNTRNYSLAAHLYKLPMNPSPVCVLCKEVNSAMNQGNFWILRSSWTLNTTTTKAAATTATPPPPPPPPPHHHHHHQQQPTTITISSILGNFYKVYDTSLSHTWKYTTKQQDLNVAEHKLVQQMKVTLVCPHWKQSPVTSGPTGCIHEAGQQRVTGVLVGHLYCRIYRVIHKCLRDFRTRLCNNQDRHGRKEHINR